MKAYYAGAWQESSKVIPVLNPFSGETIEEVPLLGPEVLDDTFASLEKGAAALNALVRHEHHAIFEDFLRILIREAEVIARLLTSEQGKPIKEARQEVNQVIQSAKGLADSPSLLGSRILPLAREASNGDRIGYTVRHAHGIVAVISPIPQPLVLMAINTLYALAAGNAVLMKPSIHTPLVSLKLVEMLLEAGCPPNAIACLTGTGKVLGQAIAQHRKLNHLICSGSLPTIRRIRSQIGFITTQLQWGCVATCVVGKSADLSRVVDQILNVAFESSGQAAFTPTWIACFKERHDELRDRLKARMEALVTGDPQDLGTNIGPLAEIGKVKRLEERIDYELSMGADIVTGERLSEGLYSPVLMDGCNLERTLFSREAIAAPVIGMTPINQALDAINLIREQRHHVLTLFSDDNDWAARRAIKMPFNNVHINGIPSWRDGLICLPGSPVRTGRRTAADRISDMSHVKDVVFH